MVTKDVDIIGQKRSVLESQIKEAHRASLPTLGGAHIFRFIFQLGNHIDELYKRLDELPRRVEHLEKKVKMLTKRLEKKERLPPKKNFKVP